ncbi:expressed unknown protein [Seminavis robusta]|uniref:Uncharacterized protein n=1 Tax=Seminavis robusta TaxID=568900 RepID=A0A9N8ED52_9STRA|nr:expressed unknown protein [Seminavis robusta]|eukprot:Sro948_g223610.1 n/a (310) ;mRNA; r:37493-38643
MTKKLIYCMSIMVLALSTVQAARTGLGSPLHNIPHKLNGRELHHHGKGATKHMSPGATMKGRTANHRTTMMSKQKTVSSFSGSHVSASYHWEHEGPDEPTPTTFSPAQDPTLPMVPTANSPFGPSSSPLTAEPSPSPAPAVLKAHDSPNPTMSNIPFVPSTPGVDRCSETPPLVAVCTDSMVPCWVNQTFELSIVVPEDNHGDNITLLSLTVADDTVEPSLFNFSRNIYGFELQGGDRISASLTILLEWQFRNAYTNLEAVLTAKTSSGSHCEVSDSLSLLDVFDMVSYSPPACPMSATATQPSAASCG